MKQKTIIALTVIGLLLVATIGATFAYFVANNQNDGNDTNISVETEQVGSILWTGTKVFTSFDLLPGHPRPTEWIGQVGLMYPSDYGYATSGGSTGREICLATELYNWDRVIDCYNNDWLYDSSFLQWILTSQALGSNVGFSVYENGRVATYHTFFGHTVSPVLYLSSNVRITRGDGSESSPFTLSL